MAEHEPLTVDPAYLTSIYMVTLAVHSPGPKEGSAGEGNMNNIVRGCIRSNAVHVSTYTTKNQLIGNN